MCERVFSKDKDFFMFVVNHSRKKFNVLKVYGDNEINEQVIAKRKETGDDIRGFSSKATIQNINQEIKNYENQYGYKYTTENLIQRFK